MATTMTIINAINFVPVKVTLFLIQKLVTA